MRQLIAIILGVVACFCGCTISNAPKVVSKTYDTHLDSLYIQCADLKGVGLFEIGMSWNTVMTSKVLSIDPWYRKPSWFNGHWGVSDFEMEKWIIQNHPDIKQFPVEVSYGAFAQKYTLGDIEFKQLDLAFLNDKLVAVYYEFGYDVNKQEIYNHYVQKYGEGIGSYYSSEWNNHSTSLEDFACDNTIKETRQWKNEKVTLQYTHDERHLSYPKRDNKRGMLWNNEYYIVYDEKGFETFERVLEQAKDEYKGKKNDEHSESMNSL